MWRLVGRLHALAAFDAAGEPADGTTERVPVLVLTPQLPRPKSPPDRILRSVGPSVVFDCIELYDDHGADRLHAYATADTEAPRTPQPGFWAP